MQSAGLRLFGLAFLEIQNQRADLHVQGIQGSHLTRVKQCGSKISPLPCERYKGAEYLRVGRMLPVRALQQCQCLVTAPAEFNAMA